MNKLLRFCVNLCAVFGATVILLMSVSLANNGVMTADFRGDGDIQAQSCAVKEGDVLAWLDAQNVRYKKSKNGKFNFDRHHSTFKIDHCPPSEQQLSAVLNVKHYQVTDDVVTVATKDVCQGGQLVYERHVDLGRTFRFNTLRCIADETPEDNSNV